MPCGRALGAVGGIFLASLTFLPGPATGAAGLQITDIAGDANGLNAIGVERDTRPASWDPGDLIEVAIRTGYVAIPVGDDGIHYEPTALEIELTTTGTPGLPHDNYPEFSYRLVTELSTETTPCTSAFSAVFYPSQVRAEWEPLSEWCPGFAVHAAWTVAVDEQQRKVSLSFPFSSLKTHQKNFLDVDRILSAPFGETRGTPRIVAGSADNMVQGALLDSTPTGEDFVVGQDVPPDVPCTRNCPRDAE